MVQCGDELVAFVTNVAGLFTDWQRLYRIFGLLFALPFIGVKNLNNQKKGMIQVVVLITLTHGNHTSQIIIKVSIFGHFWMSWSKHLSY